MTAIEKIDFIIKTTKWSDRRFTKKFYLKKDSLEKWRNKEIEPMEKDVRNICKYFHLEISDFLDANKIIFLKNTDKFCNFSLNEEEVVSEDYPNEDNARYEEKE